MRSYRDCAKTKGPMASIEKAFCALSVCKVHRQAINPSPKRLQGYNQLQRISFCNGYPWVEKLSSAKGILSFRLISLPQRVRTKPVFALGPVTIIPEYLAIKEEGRGRQRAGRRPPAGWLRGVAISKNNRDLGALISGK